jgi:hypothetical protein
MYPGCEAPSTTFLRTIYIDPARGAVGNPGTQAAPLRTLSEAITSKVLRPGDRVILAAGDHGSVFATAGRNPELAAATRWLWLDFQPGAFTRGMETRDLRRWLITGALGRPTPGVGASSRGFAFSGGELMVIADSRVATVDSTAGWGANEWIRNTGNGISARNTRCVSMLRNRIENVRFGISVSSDAAAPAQNAVNALVQGNVIKGFSGDGIRPLASNILIRGNVIADSYAGSADGDANHDDGIQLFALNGAVHDRISIEDNWIQETLSPSRSLIGPLQGIGHFDGPVTNFRVVNNVVLTSVWHGIASGAPANSLFERNTVANYTANGRKSWVRIGMGKDGSSPQDVVVSRNTARSVSGGAGVTLTGNVLVADPVAAFTTFDPAGNRFVLTPRPGGPLAGTGAGATLAQPAY